MHIYKSQILEKGHGLLLKYVLLFIPTGIRTLAVRNEFTGYAYIVLVLVLGPTDHDLSARSKLHMYCIYVANAVVTSMN